MRFNTGITIVGLIVVIAGCVGWVMNIYSLIVVDESMGMSIARGIGIIVAPLGAVLGFF